MTEIADRLSVAIKALRAIYDGASVTGRWIDAESSEAVGHDPDEPDEGYYDNDKPPAGYDAEGYCGFDDDRPDPAEPLTPAYWDAYSLDEQSSWLESCAYLAKAALNELGESVS